MTRQQHLDWAKERALEFARQGNLTDAYLSLLSDLGKHDETRDHNGCELMNRLVLGGFLGTKEEMIEFIEGFNQENE